MQFSYKLVCPSILIQNKLEGHISKSVAKIAILWPKIAKLYLLALDFGFWAPIFLQGLTWAMLYLSEAAPACWLTVVSGVQSTDSVARVAPPPSANGYSPMTAYNTTAET